MHKTKTIIFTSLLLLLLAGSSTALADGVADSITVSDAWVREVPPVSETSALFMTLKNSSDTETALVSASGEVSKLVELHTHETDEKGIHRMFEVEKIVIPANGEALLKPMSYHIMLISLHNPLKAGDTVAITLEFEDGSNMLVEAPVKKMMMPAMDHSKHMNHK